MAAADAPDWDEWSLYTHGTAQALAKHIDNAVDSSVLFADTPTTINGGVNATEAHQAAALVGCGSNGGSLRVRVNASDQTYLGPAFPEGYTTQGILIKILASGA
jgi:hypothetical protein